MFQAAESAAVAHKPFADDQHSSGMHNRVELLHVIAEFCAQCTVEPVGQILYRDFVGQRLIIARVDRVDLPEIGLDDGVTALQQLGILKVA